MRLLHQLLLVMIMFIFMVMFFSTIGEAKRLISKQAADRPSIKQISKEITVSPSGREDYRTVQDAIDHGVPENNSQWIRIFIIYGTYKEQVTIPENKPYIFLQGDTKRKPTIEYWDSPNIFQGTIIVKADNFLARGITFKNSYDMYSNYQQAVAAWVHADKVAFYECTFLGVQDTLNDDRGRHYFYKCYIEGYIDFIFGCAQSVYEETAIVVKTRHFHGPGYITAQRRESSNETTGFVFKSCEVRGSVAAYLGRAWGPYSRVLYYNSSLSGMITPLGWDAWSYKGQEQNIVYSEVDCRGEGSNKSKRVSWEKYPSPSELQMLVGRNFINSDGWIEKLPL